VPARGDHEARRRGVSAAVWRVLAAHGFDGLTLRAVAAEMGATTGLLTHYFPTKRALVRYALEVAEERTVNREMRVPETEGIAALRAALLDVLPLTPDGADMNKVWVSSWDIALGDPEFGDGQRARYARWRGRLRPHVEAAIRRGELPAGADPDAVVAVAAATTHGLVVQALFDPERFPPDRQVALLDQFLDSIGVTPCPSSTG